MRTNYTRAVAATFEEAVRQQEHETPPPARSRSSRGTNSTTFETLTDILIKIVQQEYQLWPRPIVLLVLASA